jgi:hypothetical protein
MRLGLTIELALWLIAVVLVVVLLKQMLFRLLMAIVARSTRTVDRR